MISKSERGYALREDKIAVPVSAQNIVLSREMTADAAFQAIATSCVHHFARNRDPVIAGNAEGVHQMRVGLRRLRAAISVFKRMLRGAETEKVKASLKWLTEELGPARDIDVFVAQAIKPMAKTSLVPAAAKALEVDIIEKQVEGFKRAKRAATSGRYRRLVLDTVLWINGGKWTKMRTALMANRREQPVQRLAAHELARRTRRILISLDKFDDLSPIKQHKLRIAIKKLNYATDFFESLFPHKNKAIRKFSAASMDLQSFLGQLNDIRVHSKLAKAYATPLRGTCRAAPKAFAMGELTGEERARNRTLLKAIKRRAKLLERCKRFWG